MNIKPIRTENDYKQALARLEIIFDAEFASPERDELEILGMLVEKYENEHYSIPLPDPIEAIKFRMQELGYKQTDLANVVGLKSRASEILSKKRKLTLEMIRQINAHLKIPIEVLVQAY